MTLDQLRRTGARAALVAAVVGIPADLFHFTIDSRAAASQTMAFRVHILALLVAFTLSLLALATTALSQQGRAGRVGAAGALLALLGTTFVIGDLAKEGFALPLAPEQLGDPQGYYLLVVVVSFLVLAAGWILTAAASRRAGLTSRPATALLVVGALLAVPPIPGAYVTLLLGIAVVTRQAAQRPLQSSATGAPAPSYAVGA